MRPCSGCLPIVYRPLIMRTRTLKKDPRQKMCCNSDYRNYFRDSLRNQHTHHELGRP